MAAGAPSHGIVVVEDNAVEAGIDWEDDELDDDDDDGDSGEERAADKAVAALVEESGGGRSASFAWSHSTVAAPEDCGCSVGLGREKNRFRSMLVRNFGVADAASCCWCSCEASSIDVDNGWDGFNSFV